MKTMKIEITGIEQAKSFIEALVAEGKDFHFDDDPREIIDYGTGERVFTDEEVKEVSQRLDEMYTLDWGIHECPIGYVLHLQEDALHQAARDFMGKHSKPNWLSLSLDDWLAEYGEHLSAKVRDEGYDLLEQF
jgi:hypothetical protein